MHLNIKKVPGHDSDITVSLCIWLGLVLVISLANRHIFTVPVYETGDGAANALQIIDAKSFTEIYGNYSRWRFNHPGPFFFYMYALGEILFHDLLPVFPAPANAHTFIGIALQSAFFVVSLHIARGYFRSAFFLPLALSAALIHFYFVARIVPGSVFLSLWPPHVIAFPLMCFLVSCASLATGKYQHLPIAVFCGGVLIHGHVAQPLFVLPIGLGSYLAYAINYRKNYPGISFLVSRPVRLYHLVALIIVAIFALPIVLDMLKGQDSNFASILAHMEKHRRRKEWAQALVYVISFFGYLGSQEISVFPLDALQLFFAMSWFHFIAWFAIVIYTCRCVYLGKRGETIDRRFEIYFSIVIILAFFLSLVWAKRQDGLLFNFNAYFIFYIIYCILLIFVAHIEGFIKFFLNSKIRIFLIAFLISLFAIFHVGSSTETSNIMKQVDLALARDINKYEPKKIEFHQDYWPQAVSVALALKRKGVPFYVDHKWGFLFGKENVWKQNYPRFSSIWSIQPKRDTRDEIPFISNMSIVIKPNS